MIKGIILYYQMTQQKLQTKLNVLKETLSLQFLSNFHNT